MISALPTIATAARQMRNGQLRARELVEFCLAQIDKYDSELAAWVWVDRDGALERAEQLDRVGNAGPLHGIPIGIKDIVDVQGIATRAGSPLRGQHRASRDAEVVRKLRDAGAIILGKTVTTEFACFDPPPTRNPWNYDRTPGGSSSGSAAAVASQMCMVAIGSQTGGSIVRPASYCGVAGFKPSWSTISTDGVVPISSRLDHVGPIARCVADLEVVTRVLSNLELSPHDRSTEHEAPPRLSLINEFFYETADPQVIEATRAALDQLNVVESFELPAAFNSVHASHRIVMAVDAAAYHQPQFEANRPQYGRHVADLIQTGLETSAVEYSRALDHQSRFFAEVQAAFSTQSCVAVTPSTTSTAPDRSTTGDPAFNSPWSFAGLPTVTIPCGHDSQGMPCGLQLIGHYGSDAALLKAAAWSERKLGVAKSPPLVRPTS